MISRRMVFVVMGAVALCSGVVAAASGRVAAASFPVTVTVRADAGNGMTLFSPLPLTIAQLAALPQQSETVEIDRVLDNRAGAAPQLSPFRGRVRDDLDVQERRAPLLRAGDEREWCRRRGNAG